MLLLLAILAVIGLRPAVPPASLVDRASPAVQEVRAALAAAPDFRAFYAGRGFRPLWLGNGDVAARRLIDLLEDAAAEGLDPSRYDIAALRAAAAAGPRDAGALDIALSRAFVVYMRDLRAPRPGHSLFYADAALAPTEDAGALLAAVAGDPAHHLVSLGRAHPIYAQLRQDFATRGNDVLRADLDRARALPADGRRHIVVNIASAELWLFEADRAVDQMRVIVGKPSMPTPPMAGLIRFAMFNPYWNLPPDLVLERARHILEGDAGLIDRERLELLTRAGRAGRPLTPDQVDWAAVAAGTQRIHMRQLPGGANVMGTVKFMMPNRLGIYLHDTADKRPFHYADRRLSSGCVRLEDAARLTKWLFGRQPPLVGGPEEQVDLAEPVPVYIVDLKSYSGARKSS